MKEIRVSLADLKKGIKLETGEDYTVVVLGARVHRLEIEDAFFQTASAVFLPDAPLAEQADPGTTDGASFSNSELWDSLRKSQPGFADTLQKEPFDPDEDGGAAARARVSGVDRLATVLRFLHDNQDHQLLDALNSSKRKKALGREEDPACFGQEPPTKEALVRAEQALLEVIAGCQSPESVLPKLEPYREWFCVHPVVTTDVRKRLPAFMKWLLSTWPTYKFPRP